MTRNDDRVFQVAVSINLKGNSTAVVSLCDTQCTLFYATRAALHSNRTHLRHRPKRGKPDRNIPSSSHSRTSSREQGGLLTRIEHFASAAERIKFDFNWRSHLPCIKTLMANLYVSINNN